MPSYRRPPTVNDDDRAMDIYRAAAKIIAGNGFHATSMDEIAEAVDLTKGGLYYYIKGKQALLAAIMMFVLDRLHDQVGSAPLIDNPVRRLETIIAGHVTILLREPYSMAVLLDEQHNLTSEYQLKIRNRQQAASDMLRRAIEPVIQAPGRADLDPVLTTSAVLGLIHYILRWFDPEGEADHGQIIKQTTRLALHGLAPSTEPLSSRRTR